jgi:hypothetical protein
MHVSLSGVRERGGVEFFDLRPGRLPVVPQGGSVAAIPAATAPWYALTALIARVPSRWSVIQARSGVAVLVALFAAVLVAGWSVKSAPRQTADRDEPAAAESVPRESAAPAAPRPGQLAAARELAKLLTLSAYPVPGADWPDVTNVAPSAEQAARNADPAPAKKATGASERSVSTKQTAAVFSDRQLISIRDRLKLTPDQARYWPAVEEALRALTWHRSRGRPGVSDGTLDPNGVRGLVAAATPLALTLREEQKREVRTLAHLVGLEQLASQF